MVLASQKICFPMVQTIGKLNKMVPILSTIGKRNTIRKPNRPLPLEFQSCSVFQPHCTCIEG